MTLRSAPRFWGTVMTLGLAGMGLMFLAFVMDESRFAQGSSAMPVIPVLTLVAGTAFLVSMVRGPIGRAVARLFEGDAADAQTRQSLEQLEDSIAELSMDRSRVAELEERLDFTERLLAQRGELPRYELHNTPV